MDKRATRRRVGGFTLMELLVVVSILGVLIAIGLVAGSNFRRDARVKQIKTLLDTCQAAVTEYQTVTGLVINHSAYAIDGTSTAVKPFNWRQLAIDNTALKPLDEQQEQAENGTPDKKAYNVYIERFVWAASQVPSAKRILEGHKFLDDTDGDGFMEIVDPLGHPLAYAASVRHKHDYDNPQDERRYDDYLPEYDKPFFASAGLDGKWGEAKTEQEFKGDPVEYHNYLATPEAEVAKDNVYSFTAAE